MTKGKQVRGSTKSIICNIYDYFGHQANKKKLSILPNLHFFVRASQDGNLFEVHTSTYSTSG